MQMSECTIVPVLPEEAFICGHLPEMHAQCTQSLNSVWPLDELAQDGY